MIRQHLMNQRFKSSSEMKKHLKKYSVALDEVTGRMYVCLGIMVAAAYAGKWLVNRYPQLNAETSVTICIAIVILVLPLWPFAYARRVFPFIYRYCALKKRAENKYVAILFAYPVVALGFIAWTFFCLLDYIHIMEEFFRGSNLKAYIALISGVFLMLIGGIVTWARLTARRRHFRLDKQNFR